MKPPALKYLAVLALLCTLVGCAINPQRVHETMLQADADAYAFQVLLEPDPVSRDIAHIRSLAKPVLAATERWAADPTSDNPTPLITLFVEEGWKYALERTGDRRQKLMAMVVAFRSLMRTVGIKLPPLIEPAPPPPPSP